VQETPLSETLLSRLSEQPAVAVLIAIGVIVIAIGRVTGALESLGKFTAAPRSSHDNWFLDPLAVRLRGWVLWQLALAAPLYPLAAYFSLRSMVVPSKALEGAAAGLGEALLLGAVAASLLLAIAAWRRRFLAGLLQGSLVPIAAWLALSASFRWIFTVAAGWPLLLSFVLSAAILYGFGIRTLRAAPSSPA
jgi:hypothetical protein